MTTEPTKKAGSPPRERGKRADRRRDADLVLRRGCALVVSAVAAYASYVHQREFARQGGADATSAALWPLSVDGLLLLATVGLLKAPARSGRRGRWAVWSAFLLGIAVSLAANIAAAPCLAWQPVLVAGWPPVALLLSVELLAHRPSPDATVATSPSHSTPQAPQDPGSQPEAALLSRAHLADTRHREQHQRPISAETLRIELHIGAAKSRALVTALRSTDQRPTPATLQVAHTRKSS